ncbi:SIMPL domain-containing protein, partial [Candidatus Bathyarchaeota archaeon]|nr:SIMPL domain-containing protein [Candidatus Bathyarchaeota archaeon]
IGVYTEDKLAGRAIDENAGLMTDVIAAIKALGFTDEDIHTVSYSVYPLYDWEAKQVVSYQVTNMVQVKVLNLDKLGPVIDAAAAAGANKVESITFGLSDELANQLKLDAYKAAIVDAENKADVITTNLNIKITGVQSVSESSYYPYTPYRSYSTADSAKPSTPILEGNLSVTVTLNIVYIIE